MSGLLVHLVPVSEQIDSGPACVATVLNSLGRPTTIGETRVRCGSGSRDSISTLVQMGRSYGLEMVELNLVDSQLADLPFPCIVRRGGRFVLLEGRRFGRYRVVDPLTGWVSHVRGHLLAHNRNLAVLTTTAGPGFDRRHIDDKAARGWRILIRQVRRTQGFATTLAAVATLSLLTVVIGLISPVLTKVLIDEVLPNRLQGVLAPIAVGLALVTVVTFLAALLRGRLLALVSGKLDDRLMTSLFAHLMALPYEFFRDRSTGDLVQRFSSNAAIRTVLTQQTVSGLLNIVQVLVFGTALLWINPTFGACALIVGAVEIALLVLPARRIARLTRRELEQVAGTQGFTVEVAAGAAYVKASGREGGMLRHWAVRMHDQLDASMRRQRFAAMVAAMTTTVAVSAGTALLVVAVAQVLAGTLTLGTALALLSLSASFLTPLSGLIQALQALQAVQGHVQRITDVLEVAPDQSDHDRPPLPAIQGRVELCDIGFRYHDGAPWALEGVSLVLEPGTRVAVVGASGSGKTTIGAILLGLHVPQQGRVLVDGADIHAHDLGSFRRQCGVVLQDPVVFAGTIRDNVAFHRDDVTDEQIEDAIARACLSNDVARMTYGIDTTIGERGGTLSGGQKQRIALARALIGGPKLLVLDEATSALDTVTEAAVSDGLRRERTTTLVIAHRLSTVREADAIAVLHEGKLVELGTHDELFAARGRYFILAEGVVEPTLAS